MRCYDKAKEMFKYHLIAGNEMAHKHFEACNCLPSCTSIDYNPMIDRTTFDRAAIGMSNKRNANISG